MLQSSKRVLGASLLIAGCCTGAGMLGLPLVTVSAGFLSSSVAFIIGWAFMLATGLLLLEANLWYGEGIHLMTLTERTLGKFAKYFVALLFGFLFYCLLVAYLAGGGSIINEFAEHSFGIFIDPFSGSVMLMLLFGAVVFMGTSKVDLVNRLLMLGLALAYLGLVLIGLPHVKKAHLEGGALKYALPALPAIIISFGYHNLVPSLTTYLKGNARELRLSIIIGSFIPLIIYLIWNGIILGILPDKDLQAAIASGSMITGLLRETVGTSYVVDLMHLFAFFAIITSFLAVALSFVDFLSDGLKIKKNFGGSLFLLSLVLLPPTIFSYIYPSIFLTALNYAGAFGAVLLFGIIPVLMVWKGRKERNEPIKPFSLIVIGGFALFVFLMQLKNEIGI